MIVKKNTELMERKHFITRALDRGNMTQEDYDKEIPALEKAIAENLQEALLECETKLRAEIKEVKHIVSTDGDLKRKCAQLVINFLKKDFTESEIKGIMRQGYKIMRSK